MLFFISGSLRGATLAPHGDRVTLGTDPGNVVRVPPYPGHDVAGVHAELIREGEAFRLRAVDGNRVTVNGAPVRDILLADNDAIQLGAEGPSIRYRRAERNRAVKTFQQMVLDSSALRAPDVPRVRQSATFARQLIKESVAHSTRSFKVVLGLLAVLVLALGVLLNQTMTSAKRAMEEAEKSQSRSAALEARNRELTSDIEAIRKERERLERVMLQEVDRSTDLRECLTSLLDKDRERDASLSRVLERTEAVSSAVTSIQQLADAAQRVYGQSHRGVGFITLGVSFYHEDQKAFLRERLDEKTKKPVTTGFPLTLGGEGKKMIEWLTGSAFAVSADGLVLTNRHVVDPWWGEEDFGQGVLLRGFRAVREHFYITFPGREEPIPLIRLGCHDAMDVGVCRMLQLDDALPVLKLAPQAKPREGDKVILMGYPEGFQGLVNKLSRTQADALRGVGGSDRGRLVKALAAVGGVLPTLTQGVLSNRTEEALVYDAVTTSGGSGGPLFDGRGLVIGINSAISSRFTGANFGVPISFAEPLLKQLGELKEATVDAVEVAFAEAERESQPAAPRGQ